MKRKIGKIISICLAAIMIIAFALTLFARSNDTYVNIFGFSCFRIRTGSMEPELKIGDVVLVRRESPENLDVGMNITYRCQSGEMSGMIITHKLVEEPLLKDNGEYMLVTSGIYEGADNDDPIYDSQLIGKVVCKLRLLTLIYSLFETKFGFLILIIPLVAIIFSELVKVFKLMRESKDEKEQEQESK